MLRLGTEQDFKALQSRIADKVSQRQPLLQREQRPAKRNKYGAEKTVVDGIRFDSKSEAKRYVQLCSMEKAGEISGLNLQSEFEIFPAQTVGGKKIRACFYRCDFDYIDSNGDRVIEDVKASITMTREYKIKAKGMAFFHGIVIKEVLMS